MSKPQVSVVIPAYNAEKWINEAVDSVLAQTFADFELIVVDDASTDNTHVSLQQYKGDQRFHYFQRDHAGVSSARNFGVAQAQAPLIAFLDADDRFAPQKLAQQVKLLHAKPELGFVHSHFRKFDEAGHDQGLRDMSQFRGKVYPQILQEWSAIMALPTLLLPKQVFEEVGGFDEAIAWGEDIDLYFRITRHYPIDLVPEPLTFVRVHPGSASASKVGSAPSFHLVLEKAIQADPELSEYFQRRAFAKLYVNKAQNVLGDGLPPEMKWVRDYARKALGYQPGNVSAWLALLLSRLPRTMRRFLVSRLRRLRYRRG